MDNKLLYSVEGIRQIERTASAALPPGTLMKRAGEAAARLALELLGDERDLPVLVVAGPGNNGGDALEVAANLRKAGVKVLVLHVAGSGAPSDEAAEALKAARGSGARFIDELPRETKLGLAIDGLFGIGLARTLDEECGDIAGTLGALGCPVLALDVPSGLDADSGMLVGGDDEGVAVIADHTITFIGNKPGLHTCDGRDYAGQVHVATLDIGQRHFVEPVARLSGPELFDFDLVLLRRDHNSHKGTFGDVAVLGGARGMAGAPVLAARSALHAGAGRVFVAALVPGLAWDGGQPELMLRDADSFDFAKRTVVAGPGMGDSDHARHLLAKAIASDGHLVLDADALNLIAAHADLQAAVNQRAIPAVLTPHPLEAARLLGVTAAVVQADRLEAAREIAMRYRSVAVLKGSGTIIADPTGENIAVNNTGNPALATAGTGDVLAGLCGALLAQGWDPWHAALAAVWIHGAAADALVEEGIGPIGLTAGELPRAIRQVLNYMVYGEP